MDIRVCALIPVYNHAATLPGVVEAAMLHAPVIVVDDGSTDGAESWLKQRNDIQWIKHAENRGKGEALRTGFKLAAEAGYTHAITLDADGQHLPEQIPEFICACKQQPNAVLVGVRDFCAAGAPGDRHMANRVSNFWFWAVTGVRLADTQCGYRCYPLDLVRSIRANVKRYGYELELLVRTAWMDRPLVPVQVGVVYNEQTVKGSHFRPIMDCARIAALNARFLMQAFFVPKPLRALLSTGGLSKESPGLRVAVAFKYVMSEHMQQPPRVGMAVGLGVFCGFAPVWGAQMAVAALLAHALRLNKAVAVLASNVSAPFFIPFVLYLSLGTGHWLMHGSWISFANMSLKADALLKFLIEYLLGAVAAGIAAGLACGLIAWIVAAAWQAWQRGNKA